MANLSNIAMVDAKAFKAEVAKLFAGSDVAVKFKNALQLPWPDALVPPQLYNTLEVLQELIASATSAVEIVKQQIIKQQDPTGELGIKFDKRLALETVVEIFDAAIVFKGFIGSIVDKFDAPILNLLISHYIKTKPKDWLVEAKQTLNVA